jgi:hypothetical protein
VGRLVSHLQLLEVLLPRSRVRRRRRRLARRRRHALALWGSGGAHTPGASSNTAGRLSHRPPSARGGACHRDTRNTTVREWSCRRVSRLLRYTQGGACHRDTRNTTVREWSCRRVSRLLRYTQGGACHRDTRNTTVREWSCRRVSRGGVPLLGFGFALSLRQATSTPAPAPAFAACAALGQLAAECGLRLCRRIRCGVCRHTVHRLPPLGHRGTRLLGWT